MTSRRSFLKTAAVSSTAFGVASLCSLVKAQSPPAASSAPSAPPKVPPIPSDKVKEFVIAAHGDLPRVQALLNADAHLVNATWDWGGGDFETGLGGASHMGRADIAEFLLERGARLDIFAAAMLGLKAVVLAALETNPAFLKTPGPHGIPLIAHAKAGGEKAQAVYVYLQGLAKDIPER